MIIGPEHSPTNTQDLSQSVFLANENNPFYIGFDSISQQYSIRDNAILPHYRGAVDENFPLLFARQGGSAINIHQNYWGTTSTLLIDLVINDFYDDFARLILNYNPILDIPSTTTYPFAYDVTFATESSADTNRVGAELTTFTVKYNRDMDQSVQPRVTFGPADPMTDFTVAPLDGPNGGWVDPRTWQGTFTSTPITGDGYQYLRIVGGRAADDHWLVCGDDMGRHRFEIITAGTEAMRLQANGAEGKIDLTWQQNDYDLVAGYNLYRSTTSGGTYTRLNTAVIPPQTVAYSDTTVAPGQTYYYKFTVVKTDFTESEASNVASAAAIDTILPVIIHVPVTYSVAAQARALQATVTDNVSVAGVTLHYRTAEGQPWQTVAMVKNSANNTWSGSIPSSAMNAPGVHYYISATDGVGTAFAGTASTPFFIRITDNPVVNTVSPASGPATGGTTVTISGSNFKAGATVEFGGALAGNVFVSSANQITAVTPPHFPATVNVAVSNPDGDPTVKAGAFTFLGSGVSLSVPGVSGDTQRDVEIPVNLGGVSGLMAAQFGFTYDPAVLQFKSIRNGELTSGFQLQENHDTAGTVNVGLAGTTAVSGTGVVAYITFTVIGGEGATTALNLTNVQINDGAISPEISAGQLTVRQLHDVAGTVTYYAGGATVDGVNLSLQSPTQLLSAASGATGSYSFSGLYTDEYTLTPSKTDGTDSITAYDASLVLQAACRQLVPSLRANSWLPMLTITQMSQPLMPHIFFSTR